jgi:hypothetical protein
MITRNEYKQASSAVRNVGLYQALDLLNPRQEIVISGLRAINKGRDKLADRAKTIAWCEQSGISYDFRTLALFTWIRTKS